MQRRLYSNSHGMSWRGFAMRLPKAGEPPRKAWWQRQRPRILRNKKAATPSRALRPIFSDVAEALMPTAQLCLTVYLTLATIALKASGLLTARSASTLRLISIPALPRPPHRVAHTLQACGSVDTLNPQRTEVALLGAAVAVSVCETLLPSVLGYGPNVLACAEITAGKLKYSLPLCSRSYMIY